MLGLEQLADLLEQNRAAAKARVKEFSIGGRRFAFNSYPAIMGVINLSADSWYRESGSRDGPCKCGHGFPPDTDACGYCRAGATLRRRAFSTSRPAGNSEMATIARITLSKLCRTKLTPPSL